MDGLACMGLATWGQSGWLTRNGAGGGGCKDWGGAGPRQ